jgi:hypothetical protein
MDDVGMFEACEELGFLLEGEREAVAIDELGADELEGGVPLETRVKGLVDVGHATGTEVFDDEVGTDFLPNHSAHSLSPFILGTGMDFLRTPAPVI